MPMQFKNAFPGKIKIATIIWKDGIGGAERLLTDIAATLDRRLFDMRFYYLSGNPGHFAKNIQRMGFKTEFLKWKNGFDVQGRFELLKELRKFNPHIIHDHIVPLLTRPIIKMLIRRPILNTEHGCALKRSLGVGEKWRKAVEWFDFLFCDYVAANSTASFEALKIAYSLPDSKIGVIHLGIDTISFKQNLKKRKNKNSNLTIGYVGRIVNKYKGVDFLPLIAREMRDQHNLEFKFVIAGDGPDRSVTEQLCKELNVENDFDFLGWVSDVKSFLEQIDILIVPSKVESLGLTAIEALSMNVPVVAFDIHGLKEILSGCPMGKLVPFGNIRKMVEAILYFQKYRKNHDDSGRLFVQDRFSNYKMAERYGDIYYSFIDNKITNEKSN
ncbi:MAG: glycosyltransferase [Desulfobacteraceae bacterium]|nr:glycosyltransferase [Desulfobacteraceae bacterium]